MEAIHLQKFTDEFVMRLVPQATRTYIHRYWSIVFMALDEQNLAYPEMLLMSVATISAETGNFDIRIREYVSRFNTSEAGKAAQHYFDLYDNREDLGNTGQPDGWAYRGGGAIQLTGRYNYREIGQQMGVPLEDKPELIENPIVSARALALFLKNKEAEIKFALVNMDLRKARKLVNGGSHGLEQFQDAYISGTRLLGGV